MTEPQTDLIERLLREAADSWESHSPIARALMVEAAALLKHQQAELTACRAEQARLQEEIWLNHGCGCLLPYGDDGEMQCCGLDFTRTPIPELVRQLNVKAQQRASNRNVQLEAQVTTLTAALRRQIEKWHEDAASREQRAKDEGDWTFAMGSAALIECADELAAVLRAASEDK